MPAQTPIHVTTLTDQVYDRVKSLILEGQIKQGSPLIVSTIAKDFGTSLTPVRETLRLLQKDGLVDFVANKGARVSVWSQNRFKDLFAVRCSLEVLAASLTAQIASPEQIASLEQIVQKGHQAVQDKNRKLWIHTDRDFHQHIAEACGNPFLIQLIENILDCVQLFRKMTVGDIDFMKQAVKEHDAIYQAIAKKDSSLASNVMQNHILASLTRGIDAENIHSAELP